MGLPVAHPVITSSPASSTQSLMSRPPCSESTADGQADWGCRQKTYPTRQTWRLGFFTPGRGGNSAVMRKLRALSLLLLLTGCGAPRAYQRARDADTLEAYRAFLREYPVGDD